MNGSVELDTFEKIIQCVGKQVAHISIDLYSNNISAASEKIRSLDLYLQKRREEYLKIR